MNALGGFYDAAMGDRRAAAEQVMKLIREAKPDAKNVLELACGTGSILKCLQDAYEVSGLDVSGKMLSLHARKYLDQNCSGRIWSTFAPI